MPRPYPPEFRQRAVELARLREKPVVELARDLGIAESCLRNWMAQADRDEGRTGEGVSIAEREELVRLRRELRVAASAITLGCLTSWIRRRSSERDSVNLRLTISRASTTSSARSHREAQALGGPRVSW